MRSGASNKGLPPLARAAWGLAALVAAALAVLAFEVSRSDASHPMSPAQSLTRAGAAPHGPLLGGRLLTAWQLDLVADLVVLVAAAWYVTGLIRLRRARPSIDWPWARPLSFFAGLFVVVFATNGSIAVYDQVLFSAHMAGHLALVMLAPVLLLCGRPLTLALATAPPQRSARLSRRLTGPVLSLLTAPPVGLACYAAVIVGTHLTGVMNTIMRNAWAGQLEHLLYLLVGLQFFVVVVGAEPVRWRLTAPARWVLLAVAMAVDTFTGIVLLQGTSAVGMVMDRRVSVQPLDDTRTGGAIMWVGGDAIMALVMIAIVVDWLRCADLAGPRSGWLEQARITTFGERTATVGGAPEQPAVTGEIDEDDSARASYNAWLASLDRGRR